MPQRGFEKNKKMNFSSILIFVFAWMLVTVTSTNSPPSSTCTGGATLAPNFELDNFWSGGEPIVIVWGPPILNDTTAIFVFPEVTVTSDQQQTNGVVVTSRTTVIGINLTSTIVGIPDTSLNYRLNITNLQLGLACQVELIPNTASAILTSTGQFVSTISSDTPVPSLIFGLAFLMAAGLTWSIDWCVDGCIKRKAH